MTKDLTVKEFIDMIKEYPDFTLRFPVPDNVNENTVWPSSTSFVPTEICDIGYSSKVLIIDVKEN